MKSPKTLRTTKLRLIVTLFLISLVGVMDVAFAQVQSGSDINGEAAGDAAGAEADSDEWQFRVTPYLWLPSIEGSANYEVPPAGGGGNPNVSIGSTDWLELLNFAALVSGSASKGRYSIATDLVYLSLGSDNDGRVRSVDGNLGSGPIQIPVSANRNLSTETELHGLVWSLAGGYQVNQTESSSVSIFAGVRYFGTDVETNWNFSAAITTPLGEQVLSKQGRVQQDVDLWDGIIGIRGEFAIGEGNWSGLYSFDVGAGDSDLTWNAMAGVSRAYDSGDLIFVWRHLAYDEGSDGVMEDFSFGGPAVAFRFHF